MATDPVRVVGDVPSITFNLIMSPRCAVGVLRGLRRALSPRGGALSEADRELIAKAVGWIESEIESAIDVATRPRPVLLDRRIRRE